MLALDYSRAQAAEALAVMGSDAAVAVHPLARVVAHGALPFSRAAAADALSKLPNSADALLAGVPVRIAGGLYDFAPPAFRLGLVGTGSLESLVTLGPPSPFPQFRYSPMPVLPMRRRALSP